MQKTSTGFWIFIGFLAAVVLWGLGTFIYQYVMGLGVTGMRDYVSWGVYIVNFVFFIGISHAGTLISAILRVTGAHWKAPITRMAEAITVIALIIGAPMIIIDMGRPERVFNVILFGRLQSPILWDVLCVSTYIIGSILYLYIPMIPDLAILRDSWKEMSSWRFKLYSRLSLGFTATLAQQKKMNRAIAIMAILIIPIAASVHTVVSWIFGMTLRPGWHSTIFGPYFVVGAIFSGIAALMMAMVLFTKVYHLERYITMRQFRHLGYLFLAFNLLYIYFTFSEYLTTGYGNVEIESRLLTLLFSGQYAVHFWVMAIIGLAIPALILAVPRTATIWGFFLAAVFVNFGMWIKRYLIVIPTLETPYLDIQRAPENFTIYSPTWVEWSITAASFSGFILLYLLFSKIFPIVSLWETREESGEMDMSQVESETGISPTPPEIPVGA
jgi:molybdopterin-containing oxidoreductase family membrane subunit